MAVFVRGLWGDKVVGKYPKALVDCATAILTKKHPPAITYCYGTLNQHFLGWLRIRPRAVLMSEEAVCSWGKMCKRRPRGSRKRTGEVNWGVCGWRHKLAIIHRALKEHGEICWIDWDCWLLKPLPENFWQRMRQGAPLQAALLRFDKQTSPWRTGEGAMFSTHGAFIYCRDVSIIKDLLQLSEQHPLEYDEVLISRWIEQHWGQPWGDNSFTRWYAEGWEPYCYGQRFQVRRNPDPLFREGRDYLAR